MTVIRIKLADAIVSESATKKSSYHIVQSANGPIVVIDSKYKPVVTKASASFKSAQKLGLSAAKLGQATAKLKLKLKTTKEADKKAPIREKIKANNAVIKKDVTAAKKLAASAIASLAKAGLKVLTPAVRPAYITSTQPDYTISKIGKAKTDKFWVKASGANRSPSLLKPRFATGEKFDKIGSSTAAKKPSAGAKPSDKPKPVDAPKTVKRKDAVTGAKTKAKAKELKEKRTAALTGKKAGAVTGKTVASIVDKPFKEVFQKVTTTEFGAKWARDNWNFRRVGNKIVMDNPGQLMAGTITDAMAKRSGTTVDKIEQQLRDLRVPEAPKKKRTIRRARPATQND